MRAGSMRRPVRWRSSGGPLAFVEVVNAPAATPAAGADHQRLRILGARDAVRRTSSAPITLIVTAYCSVTGLSERSTTAPAIAPGSDAPMIVAASLPSGRGRRP